MKKAKEIKEEINRLNAIREEAITAETVLSEKMTEAEVQEVFGHNEFVYAFCKKVLEWRDGKSELAPTPSGIIKSK